MAERIFCFYVVYISLLVSHSRILTGLAIIRVSWIHGSTWQIYVPARRPCCSFIPMNSSCQTLVKVEKPAQLKRGIEFVLLPVSFLILKLTAPPWLDSVSHITHNVRSTYRSSSEHSAECRRRRNGTLELMRTWNGFFFSNWRIWNIAIFTGIFISSCFDCLLRRSKIEKINRNRFEHCAVCTEHCVCRAAAHGRFMNATLLE